MSAACRGHELLHKLYEVFQDVMDLPPDQVMVVVTEVPSSWLMEAGIVLPEPTHDAESAWMKQLDEMFPGRYAQYA